MSAPVAIMSSSTVDLLPVMERDYVTWMQKCETEEHPATTLSRGTIVRETELPSAVCRKLCIELRTHRGTAWVQSESMPFRMDLERDVYRRTFVVAHVRADGSAYQRRVSAHPFNRHVTRLCPCLKPGRHKRAESLSCTENHTHTSGFTVRQ